MNYRNIDLKIDQFVNYLNEDKINLIPPFQRGHVWQVGTRRKLIENIVKGRPIPAIFLYREVSGARYAYNILDGKQRLESLILFIGNRRTDLVVNNVQRYFFDKKIRETTNFSIEIDGEDKTFFDLGDRLVRDFQEYVIPTIEITLSEDDPTALDEMISLFVDINSYGEPVNRFDIVKAMSKDPLLKSVFSLIAETEKRGKDLFYKSKKNEFTRVLQRLQVVKSISGANAQVDRMWELLVEIVLFLRDQRHKNPVEILKSFIRVAGQHNRKISGSEVRALREIFGFLRESYQQDATLAGSRIATNQVHFYTIVTSLISTDMLTVWGPEELRRRLSVFASIIDENMPAPKGLSRAINTYLDLSRFQTTHVARRDERGNVFLRILNALAPSPE